MLFYLSSNLGIRQYKKILFVDSGSVARTSSATLHYSEICFSSVFLIGDIIDLSDLMTAKSYNLLKLSLDLKTLRR